MCGIEPLIININININTVFCYSTTTLLSVCLFSGKCLHVGSSATLINTSLNTLHQGNARQIKVNKLFLRDGYDSRCPRKCLNRLYLSDVCATADM